MTRIPNDDEHFRQAREAFDEMTLQRQATFLLGATVRTLARGAEELGRTLGDEVDRMFDRGSPDATERARRQGPGPAEPETARQRSPHGDAPDEHHDY